MGYRAEGRKAEEGSGSGAGSGEYGGGWEQQQCCLLDWAGRLPEPRALQCVVQFFTFHRKVPTHRKMSEQVNFIKDSLGAVEVAFIPHSMTSSAVLLLHNECVIPQMS